MMNFEVTHKDAIANSARAGRGFVGRTDGRTFGYDANTSIASRGAGGSGAIVATNAAGSSIVGNVRNPATNEYYSRSNQNQAQTGFTRNQPNANCAFMSNNYPQGGDLNGGGCLIDADQKYGQIQPSQDTLNFFTRFSKTLNANNELYAELTLFSEESNSRTTPSGVSGSTGYPGGPVSNAGVALGASHPDNPYFGSAARVRYIAADVGPRKDDTTSTFVRALLGAKGTYGVWDYDTGLLFSQDKVKSELTGYLQRDVAFALLNPGSAANVASATANSPAYAALPPGSVWRIGENANLNSAALYAALSPTISHDATSRITQLDFKASREVGKLAGGPIGVALGAEIRREETELTPTTGTDRGNIIGLGYSAYSGARTVMALFGEGVFPVTKTIELSAAARFDHYTDVGNSFTPKLGAKWMALPTLALRGTYAQGFRAPGPAENGKGGLAAFGTATDAVRCALGVPNTCTAAQVALITSPNPGLQPEKSESVSVGAVWDITPRSNLAVDFWHIKRKNEINQETVDSAIAAGHVSRDPSTAVVAGDPGAITAVLTNYINSAHTTVEGVDMDFKHRMDFGAQYGRLALGATWTHLFKWLRVDGTGASFDYAGTHGNCDVTNCMGTPADRVNLSAVWDWQRWRVGGVLNYRAPIKNIAFKDDPAGCMTTFADGTDSPPGCKIASFTTVDLTVRYKLTEKTELTGIVLNLFDRIPPHDPTSYGAIGYNPLDYYGAVGRFFKVSLRHQF
jgi:iron complex outermembrane recepter protein